MVKVRRGPRNQRLRTRVLDWTTKPKYSLAMASIKKPDLTAALRMLQEAGYKVKPPRRYKRKTFVVDLDVLEAFIEEQKRADVTISAAVNEALRLWTEAKRQASKA